MRRIIRDSTYNRLRLARNTLNRAIKGLRNVNQTSYVHLSSSVATDLRAEEFVFVGADCRVGPRTELGRYTMLAAGVSIVGADHVIDSAGVPIQFSGRPDQPRTVIGRDVWIGARAVVLRGVEIGEGAVVGAGAVVTRDVEPYEIVAGVPARVVSERFPDRRDRQLHSERLNGVLLEPNFAGPRVGVPS